MVQRRKKERERGEEEWTKKSGELRKYSIALGVKMCLIVY
jgi:hypothetical protein